jgi:predicted GNAT family N-acyltransferase
MTVDIVIQKAEWGEESRRLTRVRTAVFVREQKVPVELELDGRDPDCRHVLALDGSGRPVGAGRMLPDGHIGRVAVLADYRGRGIGRRMLELLIEIAGEMRLEQVKLGAQMAAIGFYERLGFVAYGGIFMDAGLPHRMMAFRLP